MELVHLKNCNNCSISFLKEKLVIEDVAEICPICYEKDDALLQLVYVNKHSQLEPSLSPHLNHYRCLCCSSTFINPESVFNMFLSVMLPVKTKPNTWSYV